MGALLWLIVVEICSCALGGYIAGRLRTKWVDVHSNEVYFRDTAHGFLVWAVALVVTAAFLGSAANTLVGGENRTTEPRSEASVTDSNRYFVDSLFRSTQSSSAADDALRAEAGIIFAHSLHERQMSEQDKNYLIDSVVAHTGISRPAAEGRVNDAFELNRFSSSREPFRVRAVKRAGAKQQQECGA